MRRLLLVFPLKYAVPTHARSAVSSVLRVFSSKQEREPATIPTERRFKLRKAHGAYLNVPPAFQFFDETGSITPVAEQVYFVMLYADFILSIGTFDAVQPCRPAKPQNR